MVIVLADWGLDMKWLFDAASWRGERPMMMPSEPAVWIGTAYPLGSQKPTDQPPWGPTGALSDAPKPQA